MPSKDWTFLTARAYCFSLMVDLNTTEVGKGESQSEKEENIFIKVLC